MKLLEALKIVNTAASEGASEYRVYLACSFTPLHLQTFLTAQLRERLPDSDVKVEVGTYGDLIGNLKRLQKSSCQAAAVIIEWSDLDPRLALRSLGGWGPSVLADIQASVSLSVNRLFDLIKEAAASMPIAVCLPTLPLPPLSYLPASQAAAHEIWLRREFHDFALDLSEIQGLKLINEQRLDSASPLAQRLDVKSELTAGFPYSITHANEVADLLAQLIRPVPSKKGLITDLDDTLWRGLLGEVGVTGISWDLDNHTHIHAMYQQLLAALAESGVLIGVASKNDRHLVNEAFERDDLLLPRDYVFPLEVNWREKSRAVGNILRAWNVSADSVVFVDDNALELAEVKSLYPEIECLLFPRNDNQAAYELFEKLRDLFGKQTIVEEDAIRLESLKRQQDFRAEAKEAEPTRRLEDFLKDIDAELTINPIRAALEARAFELINKTNQFNLNGKRLTEPEFRAVLQDTQRIALVVSYKDKFGPLGNIAVLLGRLCFPVLSIDTWVMSCRAFGRQIEHKCLEYLFEVFGVSEIDLDYRQTARNELVREFLRQFMDEEPTSKWTIGRDVFQNRKPKLSHRTNNVTYV